MAHLFQNLESNDPQIIEESKNELTKTFSQSKHSNRFGINIDFGCTWSESDCNSVSIACVSVRWKWGSRQ